MPNDVNNSGKRTPAPANSAAFSNMLQGIFSDSEELNGDDQEAVEQPVSECAFFEEAEEKDETAIADAIAQAIATSFEKEDTQPVILSTLFSEETDGTEGESEGETLSEILDETTDPGLEADISPSSADAPRQPSEPIPATEQPSVEKTAQERPVSPAAEEKKQPVTQPAENSARTKQAPAAAAKKTRKSDEVHNPGTGYAKISRSTIRVTPKEYFQTTFSGVIDRQKEALPPIGVDLKTHERKLSMQTGIERLLSPARYVIFILMMLCLAGRKYNWMTLGFMGGIKGTYVSLILTIAAMIVCWESTYRSVRDIFYLRFSHESYLLIATVLSAVEALMNKNEATLLPILAMSWCVCGMSALMTSQANLRSLRAVITGRSKVGLRVSNKLWNGYDVIGKAPSGTAGFVRRQAEPDPWHSWHTAFFIPMLMICLVASAYISAKNEMNYLTVAVTIMNISMPVSMALCCARPFNLLSQALTGQGVVAGWYGIKSFSGKKAVMIYDNDLFPKGTVGHKGVKVYGRMTASQLVSYGASIVLRANIGLDAPFIKLVQQTNAQILEISHLTVQEGGVEARIHRNRVQVGTYHYMQLMGVSMPIKGSSNGIYIAVNGSLAGLFAIKYGLRAGAISGFHRFVREKTLTSLIVTRNFTVNPAFIERSFKAPITRLLCPKSGIRRRLSQPTILKNGAVCGYTLREGVSAYSRTVGGARRVHRMGVIYTVASICFSLYLMVDTISAFAAGTAMIDATRVLLVHLLMFVAVEIGARLAVRK